MLTNLQCPAAIGLLIHYHYFSGPVLDSPINKQYTAAFLECDLIEPLNIPCGYTTTEKGAELVDRLCKLPIEK
jgi:hypothetical protein